MPVVFDDQVNHVAVPHVEMTWTGSKGFAVWPFLSGRHWGMYPVHVGPHPRVGYQSLCGTHSSARLALLLPVHKKLLGISFPFELFWDRP